MNFIKRLFSFNKKTNDTEKKEEVNFTGINTKESFNERYILESIDAKMLDGCLKMIESYFIDNKIERKIENPINHPINLDQVDREGFGFILYCNTFQIKEQQAVLFIAYSFSEYLIKNFGFKLYRDLKPEYPLRGMTLKYDKDGTFLSIYPFEYSSKVLNGNESFEGLVEKIKSQIEELPQINEEIKKFMKPNN
jgi:hypothetical protein